MPTNLTLLQAIEYPTSALLYVRRYIPLSQSLRCYRETQVISILSAIFLATIMSELIQPCCPYLLSPFDLAGLRLLPLTLVLCCPRCLYPSRASVVYRFPGCVSALVQDLPSVLQETEEVSELLSDLEMYGEREILTRIVLYGGKDTLMERVVSAYVGDLAMASDDYFSEGSSFYISSIDSEINAEREEVQTNK